MNIKSVSEVLASPVEFSFLMDGYIPAQGVGVLYGETNVGKTAFALYLAVCWAAGITALERGTKATRVLYCIAEGLLGLAPRLRALCEHLDIDPASLDPYLAFRTVPTNFSYEEVRAEVEAELREKEFAAPGVFIMDTHSTHAPAGFDENSTAHAKELGDGFRAIARDYGALVLVIHHSGWNTDRIRGASDLLGTVDVSLKISKKGESARALTVEKARDFAAPEPLLFALRAKHGGIIVEAANGADAALTPSQRALLTILAELDQGEPVKSAAWQRASAYEKTFFHAIQKELVVSHFVHGGRGGYNISAAGREVLGIAITPVTPRVLRSDNAEPSKTTPVTPRSYRNGVRSSGPSSEKANSATPHELRTNSGPGLESVPWDAYEQEGAA